MARPSISCDGSQLVDRLAADPFATPHGEYPELGDIPAAIYDANEAKADDLP